MKLREININSYRQFQDVKFDFTYPEGHERAGQTLDKICFIGQSATGKTSMLQLIQDCFLCTIDMEIVNGSSLMAPYKWPVEGNVTFESNGQFLRLNEEYVDFSGDTYLVRGMDSGSLRQLELGPTRLLYLSSDLINANNLSVFNQNPVAVDNFIKSHLGDRNVYAKQESYHYIISDTLDAEVWELLLRDIMMYRSKFTQMASELINSGTIGNMERLNAKYKSWADKNPNPLIPFAEHLNPILKKLGLEIDLVNTEYLVPFRSLRDESVIPVSNLSTGTKGLLLSMFPLFEANTDEAIILIDEPERSLFPDIQVELMSRYQAIAPGAQLIVATHSPFIAAAFEPEERFILYFDESGKVSVRRGESPAGDDPNDILKNDFQIDYYNELGKAAYKRYLRLKASVRAEKDKTQKEKLTQEMAALGDKYNF